MKSVFILYLHIRTCNKNKRIDASDNIKKKINSVKENKIPVTNKNNELSPWQASVVRPITLQLEIIHVHYIHRKRALFMLYAHRLQF